MDSSFCNKELLLFLLVTTRVLHTFCVPYSRFVLQDMFYFVIQIVHIGASCRVSRDTSVKHCIIHATSVNGGCVTSLGLVILRCGDVVILKNIRKNEEIRKDRRTFLNKCMTLQKPIGQPYPN